MSLRDLVERAVRAFVAAWLAALAVSAGGVVDVSTARAAIIAAVAAGVSAAISAMAAPFGVRGSASWDPANAGTIRRH